MTKTWNFLKTTWTYFKNSIAFYPTLIAIFMASLAVLSIHIESLLVTQKIADNLPFLVISDPDTARSILNTLIGGIISLMVFSFSMVMVLLNQASSNYSPRLLPGLITNKRHQVVLGIYLGTIIFCILCSINILPEDDSYNIPAVSSLLSIILGVFCLGMFIYFIHSISESIQISYIVKNLYKSGLQELENLEQLNQDNQTFPSQLNHKIISKNNGYISNISITEITTLSAKHQLKIEIVAMVGSFVREGEPIALANRPVHHDTKQQILNFFTIGNNEGVYTSHTTALKNITEVAVKAMSPGINDPGTATMAINYLALLLAKRMSLGDYIMYAQGDQAQIKQRILHFEQLLYLCFASLRTYSAHDPLVMHTLIENAEHLLTKQAMHNRYYDAITQELDKLKLHSKQKLDLEYDQKQILE